MPLRLVIHQHEFDILRKACGNLLAVAASDACVCGATVGPNFVFAYDIGRERDEPGEKRAAPRPSCLTLIQ